ncbi:hypothetical protein BDQ12DRAFT_677060, partial [Crucibulum laeve]
MSLPMYYTISGLLHAEQIFYSYVVAFLAVMLRIITHILMIPPFEYLHLISSSLRVM